MRYVPGALDRAVHVAKRLDLVIAELKDVARRGIPAHRDRPVARRVGAQGPHANLRAAAAAVGGVDRGAGRGRRGDGSQVEDLAGHRAAGHRRGSAGRHGGRRFVADAVGPRAPGRGLRAHLRPHADGRRRSLDPRPVLAPGGDLAVERLRAQPDAGDRVGLGPDARPDPAAPGARAAAPAKGRAAAGDGALAALRVPPLRRRVARLRGGRPQDLQEAAQDHDQGRQAAHARADASRSIRRSLVGSSRSRPKPVFSEEGLPSRASSGELAPTPDLPP